MDVVEPAALSPVRNAAGNSLTGGANRDFLTGDSGADVFVLNGAAETGITSTSRDVVIDFVSKVDRFDLSGVNADSTLGGNQTFTYLGSGAFTNLAGQLRYSTANGLLQGDVDGDGLADFVVEFQNFTALLASDMIL